MLTDGRRTTDDGRRTKSDDNKNGCTRLAAASDKVYQLLAHGWWFSPGTSASSTTKTGRHEIAEILLKVGLSTKNQSTEYWPANERVVAFYNTEPVLRVGCVFYISSVVGLTSLIYIPWQSI
jgi:hypothetical protein